MLNAQRQSGMMHSLNKMYLDEQKSVVDEILSTDKSCNYNTARSIAGGLMFSGDSGLKKISVLSGGEMAGWTTWYDLVGRYIFVFRTYIRVSTDLFYYQAVVGYAGGINWIQKDWRGYCADRIGLRFYAP